MSLPKTVDEISSESPASALTGAESFLISQTNLTKGATAAQIKTFVLANNAINVKDSPFNAKGDGVTDDTAAFAAAALVGGRIYVPGGTYSISDTVLFAVQRTTIVGDGQNRTIIQFHPITTGKPCFHFKFSAASTIAQGGIQGMTFDANLNTQGTKVALRVTDGEEIIISDVAVSNWTSAAHDCIGLQFRGRQTHDVSDITISADIPISIEANPNSSISIDHYHFWNCYLLPTANPCVVIADGVNLSNVTFDGYQAWVGGTYGLFWNDTTTVQASENFTIKNVRTEQGTSATAYMISITHNTNLQNLILENIYGGLDRKGYFFRKVAWWEIKNSVYISASAEALNIDSTTNFGKGSQNYWQTGATATISGLTRLYQWGVAVNVTLGSEFLYLNTGAFNAVAPSFSDSLQIGAPTGGRVASSLNVQGGYYLNNSLLLGAKDTSISTGVGVIHMKSANPATNAAWVPITSADGTVYFVPGWTTNNP